MFVRFRQIQKLLIAPILLTFFVEVSQAQSLPVCLEQSNFSSAPIPAAELTGAINDVAIRTDQGNLALVTMGAGANLILIRGLELFDSTGQKIDVQRQDFSIANGQRYNVDAGVQAADGADLFWNVLGDVRQLEPANGTQIYLCPIVPIAPITPTPIEALPVCLQQSNFSSEPIPGQSVADAEFAVRTDQGNLALLKVTHGEPFENNGAQFFALVVEDLQLFDSAGQFSLLSAKDLAISSTGSLDVDNGVEKGRGTDIFWQRLEDNYLLTPRNGAEIYLCGSAPPPQPPEPPTPPAPQPPEPPQLSPPSTRDTINEIISGD